jgi:CBS domain-containing protein
MEIVMKVKDAMHHYAFSVHPNSSVSEIAETMRIHDVGAVPVIEDHKISGMVTDRDIVVRGFLNGGNPSNLKARDVMTKRVITCRGNEDLQEAVEIMEKHKIRRLPVVDEKNVLIGMLSLGDIAQVSSPKLIAEAVMSVADHHKNNNKAR